MCGKPHPEGFRTVLHPDRICRAAFWIQTAVYRRRRGPNGNQVFSVTLRRRRHDLKKAQLPVPALPAYAYQEASSLVLALMPVEALWRWLREDVTYHHASAEDL